MAGPEFSAGRSVVNFPVSFILSTLIQSGRPSDMAAELGRLLERNLRETRAVDTEGLCIVAGVKVWSLVYLVQIRGFDLGAYAVGVFHPFECSSFGQQWQSCGLCAAGCYRCIVRIQTP
jgi:hypothetical protein